MAIADHYESHQRAVQRHMTLFLQIAQDTAYDYPEIDREYNNITVALQRAIDTSKDKLDFVETVVVLAPYFVARGHYNDAMYFLEAALTHAEEYPQVLHARVIYCIGQVHLHTECLVDARQKFEQALKLTQNANNEQLTVDIMERLSEPQVNNGDYNVAYERLLETLEYARQINYTEKISSLLSAIAGIEIRRGDYELATERLQESLPLAQSIKDHGAQVFALQNLGVNAARQGHFDIAIDYIKQAYEMEDGRNRQNKCLIGINLGVIYGQLGEYDEANYYLKQARNLAIRIGSLTRQSDAVVRLGSIAERQGEYKIARKYFNEALVCAETLNYQAGISSAKLNLSAIYDIEDELDVAVELAEDALSIVRDINDHELILEVIYNLSTYYVKLAQFEQAEQRLLIGDKSAPKASNRMQSYQWLGWAKYHHAQHHLEQAVAAAQNAIAEAKRNEVPLQDLIGMAMFVLAKVYYKQKHLAQAQEYANESYRILAEIEHYQAEEITDWIGEHFNHYSDAE